MGKKQNNVYEHFNSVGEFLHAIGSRENNGFFGNSSKTASDGWCGGYSYMDAVNTITIGIPEKCEKLKTSLNAFKANTNIEKPQTKPRNHYYGYAPNVPMAIIGHPKAMRQNQRIAQKIKAIELFYDFSAPAYVSADDLDKCGETILNLIYALEINGYRVKFTLSFFSGWDKHGDKTAMGTIKLKDYQQPLDLMKISFPLLSTAMFRRLGFRWAETISGITDKFESYGVNIKKERALSILKENGVDAEKTYYVKYDDCIEADFDPIKLGQTLKIIQ